MDIELISKIVDYAIMGILGFMSFLTLFFWIERVLFFRKLDISKYSTKERLEIDITNNISILSSFGQMLHMLDYPRAVLGIIVTFTL